MKKCNNLVCDLIDQFLNKLTIKNFHRSKTTSKQVMNMAELKYKIKYINSNPNVKDGTFQNGNDTN
jgi:hypothetical protein